jgi:hypothetical protein
MLDRPVGERTASASESASASWARRPSRQQQHEQQAGGPGARRRRDVSEPAGRRGSTAAHAGPITSRRPGAALGTSVSPSSAAGRARVTAAPAPTPRWTTTSASSVTAVAASPLLRYSSSILNGTCSLPPAISLGHPPTQSGPELSSSGPSLLLVLLLPPLLPGRRLLLRVRVEIMGSIIIRAH